MITDDGAEYRNVYSFLRIVVSRVRLLAILARRRSQLKPSSNCADTPGKLANAKAQT